MQADQQRRQDAMVAERNPATVAFALAAFRKRRGFERSSLAAWLGISPDQLVELTLERRPDPSAAEYATVVTGIAVRYDANPARLADALEG